MQRYLLPSIGRRQTQRLECRNCLLINSNQCGLWCLICGKIRFRIPFHILTFHPIPTIFIFHTCAEHQRVSKKIGEISPVSKVWRKSMQFVCLFHLSRILNVFYFLNKCVKLKCNDTTIVSSNEKCKTEKFLKWGFCNKSNSMSPFKLLHL